jgi:hypothetical protein
MGLIFYPCFIMKKIIPLIAALFVFYNLSAQELYVATEPASTMPKNSIGVRVTTELMDHNGVKSRYIPELMYGVTKNLMVHVNPSYSNLYQSGLRYEGWGAYAKYRFLSIDSVQRHLRGAVYGRYSKSRNLSHDREINLEGDDSGVQGGIVFTQLLHKLALSGSVNYTFASYSSGHVKLPSQPDQYTGYTLSAGYLIYPKVYENYNQPNVNLYMEFLGKSNTTTGGNYMEVAPAVQLILNSTLRIDISKRLQLWGDMDRLNKNMYLVRLEYNIFNVF